MTRWTTALPSPRVPSLGAAVRLLVSSTEARARDIEWFEVHAAAHIIGYRRGLTAQGTRVGDYPAAAGDALLRAETLSHVVEAVYAAVAGSSDERVAVSLRWAEACLRTLWKRRRAEGGAS